MNVYIPMTSVYTSKLDTVCVHGCVHGCVQGCVCVRACERGDWVRCMSFNFHLLVQMSSKCSYQTLHCVLNLQILLCRITYRDKQKLPHRTNRDCPNWNLRTKIRKNVQFIVVLHSNHQQIISKVRSKHTKNEYKYKWGKKLKIISLELSQSSSVRVSSSLCSWWQDCQLHANLRKNND